MRALLDYSSYSKRASIGITKEKLQTSLLKLTWVFLANRWVPLLFRSMKVSPCITTCVQHETYKIRTFWFEPISLCFQKKKKIHPDKYIIY